MQSDADHHEWSSVPDSVPEEWLVRYGSMAPIGTQQGRTANPDRRVDTRLFGPGLALCVGIFVVAIVGMVVPAQGLLGLAAAIGLLAAAGVGSVLIALLMIDGCVRRRRPVRDDIASSRR